MEGRAILVSVLAAALLALAGLATMLFLRIGPVKHHLLSLNYLLLSKVILFIIRFFLFAGKGDLLP
jgi:hypothetical protein